MSKEGKKNMVHAKCFPTKQALLGEVGGWIPIFAHTGDSIQIQSPI